MNNTPRFKKLQGNQRYYLVPSNIQGQIYNIKYASQGKDGVIVVTKLNNDEISLGIKEEIQSFGIPELFACLPLEELVKKKAPYQEVLL